MKTSFLILTFASALSLVACGDSDKGKTPGQKLDAAIGRAQVQGEEAKVAAQKGLAEATVATDKAVKEAADATREPRAKAALLLADATITTKIKAELAKDADLSALQVGVDTDKGHVALSGTAPTAAAKDRATKIANSIEGVSSVDNKIVVLSK